MKIHQKRISNAVKISRKLSEFFTNPACIAGIRVSSQNFKAECGHIPSTELAMILTFFILVVAISHRGLYLNGHIPSHKIVLNLFGNNSLLDIFDQVTTLP